MRVALRSFAGVSWRRLVPVAIFAILAAQSFAHLSLYHRTPLPLVVWLAAVLIAIRWPAVGIIAASVFLRVGFAEVCCTDQIAVSQAAWERVSSGGGGPYGVGYAETDPPGAPFPYGPLALLWWLPGPVVELAAAIGIMAVLAWQRAYATLAVFAVWDPWIWQTMIGLNDYSPGFLILLGLVTLRMRPLVGAGVLAVAAALKPYAFAWFLPAIGYGGFGVALVLFGATALLWSPLFLFWGGLGPFLQTIRLASDAHPEPHALNVPVLRWLALPFVALSLVARRWDDMVIFGSAAFVIFLFLDRWASDAYWFAVLPALGMALERRLHPPEPGSVRMTRRRGDSRRLRIGGASFVDPAKD